MEESYHWSNILSSLIDQTSLTSQMFLLELLSYAA